MNRLYKRFFAIFITTILFISSVTVLHAESDLADGYLHERIVSEATYTLDGGLTLSVIVTEGINAHSLRASSYTMTGSKNYIVSDSNGEEVFCFTVTGVFDVVAGVSATCTSADYSASISDDAWKLDSATAYASGNQAVGSATFIKKVLFVTTEIESCDVTLTCDADGVLY